MKVTSVLWFTRTRERQVESFYDSPVLQMEPFVLADVYLELECGALPASLIKDQHLGAFDDSANAGGRMQ